MKLRKSTARRLLVAAVLASGSLSAQPTPSAPVQAAGPTTSAPAGHTAPASPHGFHGGAAPEDVSAADPSIPPGQILVELVGPDEQPLVGLPIQLLTQFESIARGKSSGQQS